MACSRVESTIETGCEIGHEADGASDQELMRRICLDDADAFTVLVHRYERELFAYLRRYLGNAQLAEDVFQATFLRVHRKRDTYLPSHAFRPWLYAIATHQAIDMQRQNRRHRMASLDGQRPGTDGGSLADTVADRGRPSDETVADGDAQAWMLAAVDRLPEPLRSTLTLVYRSGLKHREVAAALGIPVGTVKSRLNTAINRLQASWVRTCTIHHTYS
jgi:RNA polymerase sigma-70 factor (ECF subfamily)